MPPLGQMMKDLLVELGVPPEQIIVEDRSTSTYENAVECRQLLVERQMTRIVLVTDALHMRRASRWTGRSTDTSRDHELTNWSDVDRLAASFSALLGVPEPVAAGRAAGAGRT